MSSTPVGRSTPMSSLSRRESAKWRLDEKPQPHEAAYLKLDAAQARERLKWRPLLGLDTALAWIVAF